MSRGSHSGLFQTFQFRQLGRAFGKIETPRTIEEFLQPKTGSIKYTVNGRHPTNSGQPEPLTTKNHAFYFGKIHKADLTQRVRENVGLRRVKRGTYNTQVVETAMEYASLARADGERAKFIIASCLGSFFSEGQVMDGYLAPDDEKALFAKYAKKAGMSSEDVEISLLEEQPAHRQLFAVLEQEKATAEEESRGGKYLDAIANAENTESTEVTDSLSIAQQLIKELTRPKSELKKDLRKTQPQVISSGKQDQSDQAIAYPVVELAIRIADLINGCSIQGGVDRQNKYDRFIVEFIKGVQGRYGRNEALKPLFAALNGKELHSVYIGQKNHHRSRLERNVSITRLSIWTVLAAAVAVAIASIGSEHGEEVGHQRGVEEGVQQGFESGQRLARAEYIGDLEKETMSYIRKNMATKTFYDESRILDKSKNVEVFLKFFEMTMQELELRYDIRDKDFVQLLKPLMVQFLVQQKDNLPQQVSPNAWGKYKFIFLADQFFAANKILFAANGHTETHPYAKIYDAIMKGGEWDIEIDLTTDKENAPPLHYIGAVSNPHFTKPVDLYFLTDQYGIMHLVTVETGEDGKMKISNKTLGVIKEAVTLDRLCFTVSKIRFNDEELINDAAQPADPGEQPLYIDGGNASLSDLSDLEDANGTVLYNLAIYKTLNETTGIIERRLVAKTPEEDFYALTRGREVATIIKGRLYPWMTQKLP